MKFSRVTLFACLCTLFASTGNAQTSTPATGLGEAWPNATDVSVSSSPHYHAYVFHKDGIKYIQINRDGLVLGAFAVIGKEVLALPVGSSSTATTATPEASTASAETVYQDSATTVYLESCPSVWDCGNGNIVKAIPTATN